jgi:ABC-type polysaccharide/polyol phosphate export permease
MLNGMNALKAIWERRELLWNLAARELKQRYRGSVLGFLWTLLTPLFMAVIYLFFLRLLAGRGVPMAEIIIGVFAWQFTVQCAQAGTTCVLGSANLVKKVAFPLEILPLSQVLANAIGHLLSLLVQFPVLAFLLWRADSHFAAAWPVFFLWVAWQTLFNLGITAFVGAINVYFRDTQHIVGLVLSAWFFLSPVMYNMDFAGRLASQWPWAANLLYANPLAVIINGYRAALLPGAQAGFPPAAWIGFLLVPAMLVLGAGVYRRLQTTFADMI